MNSGFAVEGLKVFIVEDSDSVRDRLIEFAGEVEGAAVVGCAGTPAEAISGILATRPGCVLLDYQLHGGTGIEVMHAVHAKAPHIVFVVLTNHSGSPYRRRCMEAGASWFLDKSTEFKKAREIMRALAPASGGAAPKTATQEEREP